MTYWQHFSENELKCRCGCGREKMDHEFMERLVKLRDKCDFPFVLTSAYRCANHPVEKAKTGTRVGAHRLGRAVDIKLLYGWPRHRLLRIATNMGFLGIGVAGDFIHLDDLDADWGPRPAVWAYPA